MSNNFIFQPNVFKKTVAAVFVLSVLVAAFLDYPFSENEEIPQNLQPETDIASAIDASSLTQQTSATNKTAQLGSLPDKSAILKELSGMMCPEGFNPTYNFVLKSEKANAYTLNNDKLELSSIEAVCPKNYEDKGEFCMQLMCTRKFESNINVFNGK